MTSHVKNPNAIHIPNSAVAHAREGPGCLVGGAMAVLALMALVGLAPIFWESVDDGKTVPAGLLCLVLFVALWVWHKARQRMRIKSARDDKRRELVRQVDNVFENHLANTDTISDALKRINAGNAVLRASLDKVRPIDFVAAAKETLGQFQRIDVALRIDAMGQDLARQTAKQWGMITDPFPGQIAIPDLYQSVLADAAGLIADGKNHTLIAPVWMQAQVGETLQKEFDILKQGISAQQAAMSGLASQLQDMAFQIDQLGTSARRLESEILFLRR